MPSPSTCLMWPRSEPDHRRDRPQPASAGRRTCKARMPGASAKDRETNHITAGPWPTLKLRKTPRRAAKVILPVMAIAHSATGHGPGMNRSAGRHRRNLIGMSEFAGRDNDRPQTCRASPLWRTIRKRKRTFSPLRDQYREARRRIHRKLGNAHFHRRRYSSTQTVLCAMQGIHREQAPTRCSGRQIAPQTR